MTQSEQRRKLSGDITTELCGLSGLSQVMNTSENEALFALADLLGPAVNRLLGLLEESDNIDSFAIPEDAIETRRKRPRRRAPKFTTSSPSSFMA